MPRLRLFAAFPVFSLTLTFAWIVGVFTLTPAPLQDLWRPLIVALIGVVLWATAASVLFGRVPTLMIVVLVAWFAVLGAWPIVAAAAVIFAWRTVIQLNRRARKKRPILEPVASQAKRVLNAFGFALSVIALVSLATSEAIRFDGQPEPAHARAEAAPNLYFLLLDGYPRGDTLVSEFGYHNAWLTDQLAARGFQIADESRSNYNTTLLTLASMLHMTYVESIDSLHPPPDDHVRQARRLTAAINQAPAIDRLWRAGYRIVFMRSLYGEGSLTNADEVHESGALTSFEEVLVRSSGLGRVILSANPDLVMDQYRHDVLTTFHSLGEVAATSHAGPTAVFAHSFAPHAPILFNADGTRRPAPECYPAECTLTVTQWESHGKSLDEYGEALTGYLEYVNLLVIEAVDRIIRSDSDAVVVLFSDHGARHESGVSDEHFRVFFATRTTQHENLFPGDISLVNVFPLLFNAYFGDDHDVHPYRAWWADPGRPLELTPHPHSE